MIIDGVNFIGMKRRDAVSLVDTVFPVLNKDGHQINVIIHGLKSGNYLAISDEYLIGVSLKMEKAGFLKMELKTRIVSTIPLNEIIKVKRDSGTGPSPMIGVVWQTNILRVETKTQEYYFEFFATDLSRSPPEIISDIDLFSKLIAERIPKVQNGKSDVPNQIRELAKLRDEGLITEDESNMKKKQLLRI